MLLGNLLKDFIFDLRLKVVVMITFIGILGISSISTFLGLFLIFAFPLCIIMFLIEHYLVFPEPQKSKYDAPNRPESQSNSSLTFKNFFNLSILISVCKMFLKLLVLLLVALIIFAMLTVAYNQLVISINP